MWERLVPGSLPAAPPPHGAAGGALGAAQRVGAEVTAACGLQSTTPPFLLIKRLLKTKLNALYTDPSFLLSFPPLRAGFVEDANPAGNESALIALRGRRAGPGTPTPSKHQLQDEMFAAL